MDVFSTATLLVGNFRALNWRSAIQISIMDRLIAILVCICPFHDIEISLFTKHLCAFGYDNNLYIPCNILLRSDSNPYMGSCTVHIFNQKLDLSMLYVL